MIKTVWCLNNEWSSSRSFAIYIQNFIGRRRCRIRYVASVPSLSTLTSQSPFVIRCRISFCKCPSLLTSTDSTGHWCVMSTYQFHVGLFTLIHRVTIRLSLLVPFLLCYFCSILIFVSSFHSPYMKCAKFWRMCWSCVLSVLCFDFHVLNSTLLFFYHRGFLLLHTSFRVPLICFS